MKRSCADCRFSDVLKNSGHFWDVRLGVNSDALICRWGPPTVLNNPDLGTVDHPRMRANDWCYRFEKKE